MNNNEKSLHRKTIEQIPMYIAGKSIEDVKKEFNLSEVVKLASNENILGPSKKAVEAIKGCIDNLHLYPDPEARLLKNKIAEKIGVEPENVIVGSGSDEIISMINIAFLHRNEEVIMPWPSFIRYLHNAIIMEAKTNFVPLAEDFKYDIKAIIDSVTYKTKFIYITNPNNPTGRIMNKADIEYMIEGCPDEMILIIDEAYKEFVEDEEYPETVDLVNKYPNKNVIILRTFSKLYGLAGLRIGYAISRKSIINMLYRVKSPFNTSTVAQVAALAALDDIEHVEKTRKLIRDEKVYIYRRLLEQGINFVPSETNFILINTGVDGKEVFNRLQKDGIIVRDMRMYKLDTYVRITIGLREQNKKMLDNMFKIIKQLGEEK
ncbi:MAG: histidinol-phosphate transaminase [Candidatus Muirbacterium halophilum]|nr:histidinol-phosphate transaminase [Candidatus Muirbacterium halophilum]